MDQTTTGHLLLPSQDQAVGAGHREEVVMVLILAPGRTQVVLALEEEAPAQEVLEEAGIDREEATREAGMMEAVNNGHVMMVWAPVMTLSGLMEEVVTSGAPMMEHQSSGPPMMTALEHGRTHHNRPPNRPDPI